MNLSIMNQTEFCLVQNQKENFYFHYSLVIFGSAFACISNLEIEAFYFVPFSTEKNVNNFSAHLIFFSVRLMCNFVWIFYITEAQINARRFQHLNKRSSTIQLRGLREHSSTIVLRGLRGPLIGPPLCRKMLVTRAANVIIYINVFYFP